MLLLNLSENIPSVSVLYTKPRRASKSLEEPRRASKKEEAMITLMLLLTTLMMSHTF